MEAKRCSRSEVLLDIRIFDIMKSAVFIGRAKDDMSAFPAEAKSRAGHELFMVQVGRDPSDWRPMKSVGPGTREIRVRLPDGAFRVIYVAVFESAVYVLHAFQKKSQATSRRDIEIARRRYREVVALERSG